jgi:DNA (cytosine-5)-methyltransferase 1
MSAHQKKYLLDFKTQYGLGFDPQDDEIVVEFFCGGGAAGAGLEMGPSRAVSVAGNYGSGAIRMRPANYLLAAINLCKFYVDDTQETLAV